MLEELRADVLVAGGGMGGLMAAIRAQMSGATVVLLAGTPGASDRMAGFSTVLLDAPQDRPEALFNDLFVGGGFINNPAVVAAMVERIGPETRFFEEMGVPFVRQDGRLARRQASGVTWPRAVYTIGMVGVDASKLLVQQMLASDTNAVHILNGAFLYELQLQDGVAAGGLAYLPAEERWIRITASAVVLATGGAGYLYSQTTNPPGSQGIGYAMALEAGASLLDMEFVSFEPFVVVAPSKIRGMELPTMALKDGVRLVNGLGEEFIDTSGSPSKDVICRAMLQEVSEGRGTSSGAVYYDLTRVPPEVALSYSQVRRVLKALDLTPGEARLEIMPSQHFMMGGIRVDEKAASTEVPGLYAVGEVAGGAHGAHRLATCGGTEVIAMGAIAGDNAAQHSRAHHTSLSHVSASPRPQLLRDSTKGQDLARLDRIRTALEHGCGMLRDGAVLQDHLEELEAVRRELQAEGRLKSHIGRGALVALSVAKSALARRESRGDHFRTDYPGRNDRHWLGNLGVRLVENGTEVAITYERAGISNRIPILTPTE